MSDDDLTSYRCFLPRTWSSLFLSLCSTYLCPYCPLFYPPLPLGSYYVVFSSLGGFHLPHHYQLHLRVEDDTDHWYCYCCCIRAWMTVGGGRDYDCGLYGLQHALGALYDDKTCPWSPSMTRVSPIGIGKCKWWQIWW